jgi:hypothetical protein
MKLFQISFAVATCITSTSAFVAPTPASASVSASASSKTALSMSSNIEDGISKQSSNRRTFFTNVSAAFGAGAIIAMMPRDANAIAGVTVAEFETILKTSAKSVQGVELSGPKSETAVVTLIDGTQFVISDLYESPTDPRSPLKLISICRSYKVPTKSIGLEQAVLTLSSSGSKKKTVYMNKRVQIAAEKEREKKIRMEQDEVERLAEVEAYGKLVM